MKVVPLITSIAVLGLGTLVSLPVRAGDENEPSPAASVTSTDEAALPAPPPRMGPPMRPPVGGPWRAPGEDHEDVVTRWLERFREAHPDEFARLRRLRESNPAAFREEIRRRFQFRRGGDGEGGEGRRGPRLLPRPDRDPDLERLEAELLSLARQFHLARDPGVREDLQGRLRAKLVETFQRREQIWLDRIAALRRDLEEFEARLERFRKERDAAIDQRLRAILEPGSPPAAPTDTPAPTPPSAQ